jgi:SAM-dependent methyltransferase
MRPIPTEENWRTWAGMGFADQFELAPRQLDEYWLAHMGVSRSEVIRRMREATRLAPTAAILEVGCNAGNQLLLLKSLGFFNLSGIDICPLAVDRARARGLDALAASARDLPFGQNAFDLVFTSGVLSHLGPDHVEEAVREAVRVSARWFWGCEYFQVPDQYRNCPSASHGYLWAGDYPARFAAAGMKVRSRERLPGGECLESFLCEKE